MFAVDVFATNKGLLITHKDGTYTFLLLNREIEMTWKNDQTLHISNRSNIDYDMSIFDMEEFMIAEQPSDVFATITQDGLMMKCKVFDEELKTIQIGAKNGMSVGLLPSSFVVPQTIHGYSVVGLIDKAFTNCTELKSITIPNHVTSIGNGVFAGCDDLSEIIVDKNNSIYDSRENCQAIIETSSNKLVAGCSKTIIPNSVTSIGVSALEGCKNMVSVIFPQSITTIGDDAFKDCDALTDVYCYSKSIPSASSTAFNNVNNATLHVPVSLLDDYKKTTPWKNFGNIVPLDDEPILIDIVPMEEDVEVAFEESITEETDLTSTVVDNVYVTLNAEANDGYDTEEKCIVLASTVTKEQLEVIADKEVQDEAVTENFNGLIFEVPAGKGTISVTAQTKGSRTLNVKIGDAEAQTFVQPERGDVEIPCTTTENTYVYIYGAATAANAQRRISGGETENGVLIYGIKWTHDESTDINAVATTDDGTYQIYMPDGTPVDALQPSVNILRYSNGTIKKVYVK